MKSFFRIVLGAVIVSFGAHPNAQGLFLNMHFEFVRVLVPPTPVNGWGGSIDPVLGFRGWTIGSGDPLYNSLTLGDSEVVLIGPDFFNATGLSPIQESYSVLLGSFGFGSPPTSSQTGFIPGRHQVHQFFGFWRVQCPGHFRWGEQPSCSNRWRADRRRRNGVCW